MNQSNHTSTLADVSVSHPQRWPRLHVHLPRPSGWRWLRILSSALVLSSILLSPVGSISAYALAVPVLLAPTDNLTTTVVNFSPLGIPEFKWKSVSGATSYRLQVSSDTAFTTTIINFTTPNTTYTPTSAGGFSDGTWYWRVRVESPDPVGEYGNIWSFTKRWAALDNKPTLISPANLTTIDFYDQPVFSWSPVTGAARYKLQIYSSSGGWSTLDYSATTLLTTHQPNVKLANSTYFWRVVPVDPGDHDGTPSAESSFVTNYHSVTTLLEPDDFATPTFTPTFRWTAVRGAQYYRLQYSTDPTFNTSLTQIDTINTTFIPTATMPNDVNYYWRVKVISGNSITDWTPSRRFVKKWYIKPVLLTPTIGYQDLQFPVYSWTPVPGASNYNIEISNSATFANLVDSGNTTNTFYTPTSYNGARQTYYWRVTPYDGNGRAGVPSDTSSYVSYGTSVAPAQVYPFYYYPPDTYSGFPGVTTNPHEDRTVPLPIFIWHRVFVPAGDLHAGQVYAEAYRLQVSTDPLFETVKWTVDTENLSAAPTTSNPFTPLANTNYFWRVSVLVGGYQASPWSQTWKTRFDLTKGLAPSSGAAPSLIRPTDGFEFAEETPLLEWFPMSGASSYDVQISLDSSFGTTVDTARVPYPAYIPTKSLAQRSLGAVDFGVYYWRVSKHGTTSWSETRRFQISAQSQWRVTRTLGDFGNWVYPQLLDTDPVDVPTTPDYELTDLRAVQTPSTWHFGFHVPYSCDNNATFVLYIDLDKTNNSGADVDALGYHVTTSSNTRPEYAIYIVRQGCTFAADRIYFYHWLGGSWSAPTTLASIGGSLSQTSNYVEFLGPNSAIGFDPYLDHYYMALYSVSAGSVDLELKDAVPSNSNPITNFSTVIMVDHPLQIGSDPVSDVTDSNYDLTDLHVSQDSNYWYFGFHVPNLSPLSPPLRHDVTYALYLDLDHQDGSGATVDARGYTMTTIPAYRPEYAIYVLQESGNFSANRVYIYHWEGSSWGTPYSLGSIGGGLGQYINECNNYVEIEVPNTAIGYQDNTGSYAISLLSLPALSGQPQDSVPSDPKVPGTGSISRFANVTERMNLSMPPNNAGMDPSSYMSIPPFSWDYPVLAPWIGATMKVYLDPGFTTLVATFTVASNTAYYAQASHAWGYDFQGDNTYYWRMQPLYVGDVGVWSQGWRFERQGFVPVNLQTSVTFATPTFSWDKVEGAESYELQVDDDPGFNSTAMNVTTSQNSYTDTNTLANGTYYWRVRIHRSGGVTNNWTSNESFTLALPTPTGLTPSSGTIIGHAPTFCWTPLIKVPPPPEVDPVLAAFRYRIQVSNDPTFSTTFDGIDTEQSCWTPTRGYDDDEYYWRVAMIDGNGKVGAYTAYQTFTKQYPTTTLVSPTSGTTIASTPTFVWTPVNGAARYKLEVSLFSTFSPTYESILTDNTRYTPMWTYASNKIYYWRVAIVDGEGKVGPFVGATIILNATPYRAYMPMLVK